MSETLQAWIEREYRYAAQAMLRSVSAVDIVKTRPGFGQSVRAAKGSIIASPVLAAYDPDPDYFFHWFRDSAVVIEALRLLHVDSTLGDEALQHFADFLAFGLSLQQLDGRERVRDASWREPVSDSFRQYLREDADLGAAHGDRIVAESRVNPDGSLDISKWARPQHDGPPLRALAVLRWLRTQRFDAAIEAQAAELLLADLAFTAAHAGEPSYDIWEEERGLHYYTLRVSAAALDEGADWLQLRGAAEQAQLYRQRADEITAQLDAFWDAGRGFYRSRVLESGAVSSKELDIAVILSAIHAESVAGPHSVLDPRQEATLSRLDALFDALYPINRDRPPERGPAMGRYAGDVYYSGGAYYFSSLGAAEFCYRAAATAADREAWRQRGDAYLNTVRAYTPENGELSEQFDQGTGAQTSARHLAWSYAALISCVNARRKLV